MYDAEFTFSLYINVSYTISHESGRNPALSPAKYIYVMRNPKDVAVSYYHHMKHVTRFNYTSEFDVYFESFIKGNVFYGFWFDHVFEWTKQR